MWHRDIGIEYMSRWSGEINNTMFNHVQNYNYLQFNLKTIKLSGCSSSVVIGYQNVITINYSFL
jgi:hypothetical protein